MIEAGSKAPDFTAQTDGDATVALNDYSGKWLVLYFYPKDNTPGCTNEACSFRDNMERITAMGVNVLGISPDSVKSHDKFKAKHNLNFTLLSDPKKKICTDYGIIVEKKMFGKTYMGVQRSTFIIGPDLLVRFVYPKVKVAGHTDDVIDKLTELMAGK